MLYGRGAGALPTASAVVSDVIYAATHSDVKYSTFKNQATAEKSTKFITDFESGYYLRLSVADEVGVLAKMTSIFAKCNVSVVEIAQKGRATESSRVPLIIITHETRENSIKKAIEKINETDYAKVEAFVRVES